MVNVQKLRGRMVEMSISADSLAKKIGINVGTLYRRFKNPDGFTVQEVYSIAEELQLSAQELDSIFFYSESRTKCDNVGGEECLKSGNK